MTKPTPEQVSVDVYRLVLKQHGLPNLSWDDRKKKDGGTYIVVPLEYVGPTRVSLHPDDDFWTVQLGYGGDVELYEWDVPTLDAACELATKLLRVTNTHPDATKVKKPTKIKGVEIQL